LDFKLRSIQRETVSQQINQTVVTLNDVVEQLKLFFKSHGSVMAESVRNQFVNYIKWKKTADMNIRFNTSWLNQDIILNRKRASEHEKIKNMIRDLVQVLVAVKTKIEQTDQLLGWKWFVPSTDVCVNCLTKRLDDYAVVFQRNNNDIIDATKELLCASSPMTIDHFVMNKD
jgi:hypothetical protein